MQQQLNEGVLLLMARKQRQIEEATIFIAGLKFPLVAGARGCSASIFSILQWYNFKEKQRAAFFAWARDDIRLYSLGAWLLLLGSTC